MSTEHPQPPGSTAAVHTPPEGFSPLDVEALGAVIVFAPHPADETLSCGGLIASLIARSVRVDLAVVTDGCKAEDLAGQPLRQAQEQRRADTARSASCLGLLPQHIHYLDYPDSRLALPDEPGFNDMVMHFGELLELCRPQTLLVPLSRESQRDHYSVSEAGYRSVAFPALPRRVLEYPVLDRGAAVTAAESCAAWYFPVDDAAEKKSCAMSAGRTAGEPGSRYEVFFEHPKRG